HPGTGTPQAIHGEGGTQGQLFDPGPRARPTPRDFQKHDIWPTSTTHDSKIKQQTEDGIKADFKRMQQDPRWEKARKEWDQLEEPSENELKMLREEAGRLTADFHYYAMKLLGVEWGNYPTPAQVVELIDEGQILEINEKGPWADVDEFLLDYVGGEEFLRADQSGSVAWEPWTDEDGNVVVDREKNQILLS